MNKTSILKITSIAIIIISLIAFTLPYIMIWDPEIHNYNPEYIHETPILLAAHIAFLCLFLLNYFQKSLLVKLITSTLLVIISIIYLLFAIIWGAMEIKEMHGGSGLLILACLFPLSILYFIVSKKTNQNGC